MDSPPWASVKYQEICGPSPGLALPQMIEVCYCFYRTFWIRRSFFYMQSVLLHANQFFTCLHVPYSTVTLITCHFQLCSLYADWATLREQTEVRCQHNAL
jgi:hypothetical protein